MSRRAVLAVDIGGTKIEVAAVDESGEVLERRRESTAGNDGEAVFALLGDACTDLLGRFDLAAVGVGCGGPMSPGGVTVSPLNIEQWRDFPLAARLASLSGLGVSIDNDAKALALGEGWQGATRGCKNFLAMVVSTGVGGGIVLDGRLLDGAGSNAGHIGHITVVASGRRCACGANGCLEAEASGTAIAAITGHPASEANEMVRRRTGMLVGRAVAMTANLLDLEKVVVSGSVALGYGATFLEAAQTEIDRRCRIEFSRGLLIGEAGLGADGPIVGAAAVGFRGLGVEVLQ